VNFLIDFTFRDNMYIPSHVLLKWINGAFILYFYRIYVKFITAVAHNNLLSDRQICRNVCSDNHAFLPDINVFLSAVSTCKLEHLTRQWHQYEVLKTRKFQAKQKRVKSSIQPLFVLPMSHHASLL